MATVRCCQTARALNLVLKPVTPRERRCVVRFATLIIYSTRIGSTFHRRRISHRLLSPFAGACGIFRRVPLGCLWPPYSGMEGCRQTTPLRQGFCRRFRSGPRSIHGPSSLGGLPQCQLRPLCEQAEERTNSPPRRGLLHLGCPPMCDSGRKIGACYQRFVFRLCLCSILQHSLLQRPHGLQWPQRFFHNVYIRRLGSLVEGQLLEQGCQALHGNGEISICGIAEFVLTKTKPADTNGALAEPTAYLTPTEANQLIPYYSNKHADIFGGVMLWEATISSRNTVCNKKYATHIKDILTGNYVDSVCPSASSSIASATSSTIPTPTAVSQNGICGPNNGLTCAGSAFGRCCSSYGFCGSSTLHCDSGCNPVFGTCGSSNTTSSAPIPSPTSNSTVPTPTAVSTNGACGPSNGFSCAGSAFGDCCSEYGFCGATTLYCDAGCNPLFGKCSSAGSNSTTPISNTTPTASLTTSSSIPTPTLIKSPNGSCGGNTSYTCIGYHMGECCSQYGFCGGDERYCDAGCNPLFGNCNPSKNNSTTLLSSSSSTIILGTGSSSVVSLSSSAPYPTGDNSTSTVYPTGTGSNPITPTDSSSIPLGTGSSSVTPSLSSVPYPTGDNSTSSSYPTGTGSNPITSTDSSSTLLSSSISSVSEVISSPSPDVPYPTGSNSSSSVPTGSASVTYGTGSTVVPSPSASSSYPITSGVVHSSSIPYASGVSSPSASVPGGYYTNSTTSSCTSTRILPTGGYPSQPDVSSSSSSLGYETATPSLSHPGSDASSSQTHYGYPVSTPAADDSYPTSTAYSEAPYPASTPVEDHASYPAGPSATGKPSHGDAYPSAATTTVVTSKFNTKLSLKTMLTAP